MNLLEKNGFILIKGALSRQTVYQIKDRLKKLKPKAYVPFTDIPWGFGNLLEDKVFSKILSNKKNYKDRVLKKLEQNGIETRPIISGNFSRQPAAKKYGLSNNQKFVNTDIVYNKSFFIGLPTRSISNNFIKKIVTAFEKSFN